MTFKPGQSGNPAGKKPGTTNPNSTIRKIVGPFAQELTEKCLANALDGDAQALVAVLNLYSAAIEASRRTPAAAKA